MTTAAASDLIVSDNGGGKFCSFYIVRADTEFGQEWLDLHVPTDDGFHPSDDVRYVEPRYLPDMLYGACQDGLVLEHITEGRFTVELNEGDDDGYIH